MEIGELWAIFGPGVAGAVFGAGWWFWVDAVVCSSVNVPFLHYLPGIFASIAALMFNCVRREDIDYSPYDDGEWRLKLWLFLAYVVSFVSLAASVGLLIQESVPVDRYCRCLTVRVRFSQWADILDCTLRIADSSNLIQK
ncbi:hypothetical protein HRI_002630600 [Hibiscus trionum]|uniref:Transmembrane protein 50A n=1 Tax=Hibiscus trionum TaxID=183268 RepID=A0A9W7M6B0_HIBTR|nr:hypothetical protein HRI_002630600 [Hibiscus trionum]